MRRTTLHLSAVAVGFAWYHYCALTFSLLLSACSSPNWIDISSVDAPVESKTPPISDYQWAESDPAAIAPGFLVHISSLDPKLNGVFPVDIDGILRLPHERSLSTIGLDLRSLEKAIRDTYRDYFKSPNEIKVTIAKKEYLIDVQGLVLKPGHLMVRENTGLDEIIALAGGLQDRNPSEKPRYVTIRGHQNFGMLRLADYHAGAHPVAPHWHGGEHVFFQTGPPVIAEALRSDPSLVRVVGQVKNPAEYPATPGATFFTYLLQAGGPSDRADLANITLIRAEENKTIACTFSSQTFREIPPIKPGDTLIVNADVATPIEKRSRIFASLASVLTSLGMIALATM